MPIRLHIFNTEMKQKSGIYNFGIKMYQEIKIIVVWRTTGVELPFIFNVLRRKK